MKLCAAYFVKTAVVIVLIGCFTMLNFLSFAADIDSAESDILINVEITGYKYRYSCDIIYYSMKFSFNLRGVETNTETGESSISYGDWLMLGKKQSEVELIVINHSDTPISVTAHLNKEDFDKSGVVILRKGLENTFIDSCPVAHESEPYFEKMNINIENYPYVDSWKGEKRIYVCVDIIPASGYATNGEYFYGN